MSHVALPLILTLIPWVLLFAYGLATHEDTPEPIPPPDPEDLDDGDWMWPRERVGR